MADGLFKCGPHKFETNDINKWDEHMAELEHEYDVHTECQCGKKIHLKPKLKLSPKAKRIPQGLMCDDCRKSMSNVSEIKDEVIS